MNPIERAFEDVLEHTIPYVLPNITLDCSLRETQQYNALIEILPKNNHVLWNRVVLNYSALKCDPDLAFYGIFQDSLLNNLERLSPDTIQILYFNYFDIDLIDFDLVEDNDEYYYISEDQKIRCFDVEKCVCSAISLDYNKLHEYIDGFFDGYNTIKK
jgi:hypothetical protein